MWFYGMILALGNGFATLLAASLFRETVPEGFPPVVWYLVLGVFGFEMILKRINVAYADIGVLSLNEWITKAKDAAIADLVEFGIDQNLAMIQNLADRLRTLPDTELNAHLVTMLGNETPHALQEAAEAANADIRLVKALTLAHADYARASKIQLPNLSSGD